MGMNVLGLVKVRAVEIPCELIASQAFFVRPCFDSVNKWPIHISSFRPLMLEQLTQKFHLYTSRTLKDVNPTEIGFTSTSQPASKFLLS